MKEGSVYCPICEKELRLIDGVYMHDCHCYDNKRFKYILAWCKDCQSFTARRGIGDPITACCRCTVKRQHQTMQRVDPEGYFRRQAAATIRANEVMKATGRGTWDPNAHILMEETKLKNGTSLSNPEFRSRIGCNGNPAEVVEKLKSEKKGIFSDKCLKLKTERFNEYWTFDKDIPCIETCKGINGCDRSAMKNVNGVCKIRQCEIFGTNMPAFREIDNALCYFDKSSRSYVPWNEYKAKFSRKRITSSIAAFMGALGSIDAIKHCDIQIIPTFRSQDATSWAGARAAFEQNLVDQNIGWFAYVKFYIDKNKGQKRPIVVGKTGSCLVNSAGTDVSFSVDINDGPARLLLHETEQQWDQTQILVVKAKSEKQALFLEWKISKTFNLFES